VRIRVTRRIAADPTSTALLLAAPTALDLWPGLRRVGTVAGRVLVEARPAGEDPAPAAAAVRAYSPRRTPTAFVTRFTWSGPDLPATDGELTLGYAPGAAGLPSTSATLTLDSAGGTGGRLDPDTVRAMAEGFLANLAAAAESRSSAA
jgi:hypothetical protein